VLPALRFALFVYGLLFVVGLPGYVVFFRLKISNPTIVLADLVMTGLGFLLIGFLLHVSAKIIRGRGTLGQSLLTGLYLIGLWPIVQLTDYLVLPSPWLRSIIAGETPSEPLPSDYMYAFLMLILLPAVGFFLVIKTVPVIRHIHSIGSFRATIAVLLGITLIFGAFHLILYPLLRELIKVGK
jgi:hypothetical protein